ncbi:MAG: fasciclin domain-containing protein, partial [Tangfeifania sp.]
MKKIVYTISFFLAIIIISCQPEPLAPNFEDVEDRTAYDYMMENEDDFSSFIAILEKGRLAKTLSAYNPDGIGYTLFLPNNDAVKNFIDNSSQFSSLDDVLNDQEFASAFSRYHVVNTKVNTNEFPFGAFSEPTLSEDFLTVSFIIETDTSFYKINNSAAVTKSNIEVSNGYIHQIETALSPVTFTSYEWLEQHPEYSIFKEAIDLTGLQPVIDFNLKEMEDQQPVTVLAEPDSIFYKAGINSISDLIAEISPEDDNYTNESNPLYNFVSYHFLRGRFFIDDFVDVSTNYTTFSEIPLNIN